jgi:hypothetical protein
VARLWLRNRVAVSAVGALGAALGLGACTTPFDQSTTVTTIHAPGSPTTIPQAAAPSTKQVLLNQSGQGSGVTKSFRAATPWSLNWSITCGSKRGSGSFNVLRRTTSGYESVGSPSVKVTESYGANAIFRHAGIYKIAVSTSCTWNAFVTEPK